MKIKNTFTKIFQYEQKVFLTLFAVFFIGFSFGAFYIYQSENSVDLLGHLIYGKSLHNFYISNSVVFLIISFLGMTLFALPTVYLCIIFSGVNSGFLISCYTYDKDVVSSVLFLLCIFPAVLLITFSHFFISFSSLRFSYALNNVFKSNTRYISPKKYLVPHILSIVFFLSCMIITLSLFDMFFSVIINLI